MKTAVARRGNILPVLIFSFAVLALLRAAGLWIGFSDASAQGTYSAGPAPVPAAVERSETSGSVETDPQPAFRTDVEGRLLDQLAARRRDLDRREREIETREKLLRVAEARLEARIAALEAEAEKLKTLQAEQQLTDEADYETLSSAYEKMKPRDAARIFEALGDDILVPVAAGMRTQAISGVLAEMDPDKARALTRKLANRSRPASEAPVSGVGGGGAR